MPTEVQNSLPALYYDNKNTGDIFNQKNNNPGR